MEFTNDKDCRFSHGNLFILMLMLVIAVTPVFIGTGNWAAGIFQPDKMASEQRLSEAKIFMRDLLSLDGDWQKAEAVNKFFNKLTYHNDYYLFSQVDYWQDPVSFLVMGSGDCEDYAIAKYFALRHAGIPKEQLHITYAMLQKGAGQRSLAHMVLVYRPSSDGKAYVLDNMNEKIVSTDERGDMHFVYAFNEDDFWLVRKHFSSLRLLGSASRLKYWEVLQNYDFTGALYAKT